MPSATVTVGVDTTPGSLDALAWAIGECRARSADLVLMHSPDRADAALAAEVSESDEPLTTSRRPCSTCTGRWPSSSPGTSRSPRSCRTCRPPRR